MRQYTRYFFFICTLLLTMNGYAEVNDHIRCRLTTPASIPTQVGLNSTSEFNYTCVNTYKPTFPAIQLIGEVTGESSGTNISGTCQKPLAPGAECTFTLSKLFSKLGPIKFQFEVSVGSLYVIRLPIFTNVVNAATNSIIWPGFNQGFAQIDSTGEGFGSTPANAYDTSGNPITYVFNIIAGPGSIEGNQGGSFRLLGADTNTVIQVTATAIDAEPVVGTPIQVTTTTVPTKILAFYNNTNEPIYPIIESPILNAPGDPWLQAEFGVVLVNTFTFTQNYIHRAYVNGINGIAPGETAFVSMPFYSNLVANPSGGNIANQYVDWWNAMRVYIYDVQSSVIQQYNLDNAQPGNPVTLYTPGPNCAIGCTKVDVVQSSLGVPTNGPQQLTEYTFADVALTSPPYPIDRTRVDYDFSGVDQIYLPLAMEPFGSGLVGYTGTTMGLIPFRQNLNNFVSQTGWPTYLGLTYVRVPGADNVAKFNPELDPIPKQNTVDKFKAYWAACAATSDCINVSNLFNDNYIACGGVGQPNIDVLISRIYGWTSFCNISLAASTFYPAAESSYHTLQYTFNPNYENEFNPYVQLIHQTLGMNVYAYSIDDAVGNINTIGDGVVLTVGGALGLANPLQYDKANITVINLGAPPPGPDPIFTNFGVCTTTPSTGSIGRNVPISFQLPASVYPCTITLRDSNANLYQFIISQPAPFPNGGTYISCTNTINPTWCNGVNINFNAQVIQTPPPTV